MPNGLCMPQSDNSYVLAAHAAEHERLIRQGTIINPLSERLFREAGLGPGQRVLDIGSGIGEVAMLAARMVGPSGSVVAAERDSATVAAARRRAEQSGLDNVSFIEGDIAKIDGSGPFDAVVFGQKRRQSRARQPDARASNLPRVRASLVLTAPPSSIAPGGGCGPGSP